MNEYQAFYEDRFVRNLARYSDLRQRIRRRVSKSAEIPIRVQNDWASCWRLGFAGLPQCAGGQKLFG